MTDLVLGQSCVSELEAIKPLGHCPEYTGIESVIAKQVQNSATARLKHLGGNTLISWILFVEKRQFFNQKNQWLNNIIYY